MASETLPECPQNHNASFYDCGNRYPNCTSSAGFNFETLYMLSQYIITCSQDWRLFDGQTLNQEGCEQLAGSNDFTIYPGADIWARLTTWKFPLLQLVAIFPRPPLSLSSEMFVIVHLLGNPVGTLKNLLLKVASCQSRAVFWASCFEEEMKPLVEGDDPALHLADATKKWKALAMIIDSYDEWGYAKGNEARNLLWLTMTSTSYSIGERKKFLKVCEKTANALAADRSTKFLPIIVAQGFFIGTIAMAFGRTPEAASGTNPPTYINIESHSIAFSALYFWIIPIVFLGSVIGVSQTEHAIPRILRRFQVDLEREFGPWRIEMPNAHLFSGKREVPATIQREVEGGIYSWVPEEVRRSLITYIKSEDYRLSLLTQSRSKSSEQSDTSTSHHKWTRWRTCPLELLRLRPGSMPFALLVILSGLITGCLISILVPPVGFTCRSQMESAIVAVWLLNAALDYIPWKERSKGQFWFMFAKDLLSTLITTGAIIVSQIGILNRCSCYTMQGTVGLALPEVSAISQTLFYDIKALYPAIAFLGIGLQLIVFPAIIAQQYHMAMRIFLQRDDGISNMHGWHSMKDFFRYRSAAVGRKASDLLGRVELQRFRSDRKKNIAQCDSGATTEDGANPSD